jgi:hypothetical protein
LKPFVPKTIEEAELDWIKLGKASSATVKRFCAITGATPELAETAWNALQDRGMMLLDKEKNTAWIYKNFKIAPEKDSIEAQATALYDDLSADQIEDISELVRQGFSVQQATSELGLDYFAINSISQDIYDNKLSPEETFRGKGHAHSATDVAGPEQKKSSRDQWGKHKHRPNNISVKKYRKMVAGEDK